MTLFVRNSVGSVVVDTRNVPSGCELLCVDFIANIIFRFIVVYCPLDCPTPETKQFLYYIADWALTESTSVVVGDFNLDLTYLRFHRGDFAGVNFLSHNFLLGAGLYSLLNLPLWKVRGGLDTCPFQ